MSKSVLNLVLVALADDIAVPEVEARLLHIISDDHQHFGD